MQNFDLTTLPRCDAKTKQGGRCQRYGTKRNGRCKLHGGRSTGPKTDIGKLNSSTNSGGLFARLTNSCFPTQEDIRVAIETYKNLMSFLNNKEIDWETLDIFIGNNLLKLERFKYLIAIATKDISTTTNIQQALDNYYMHNGNEHLRFHSINVQPQFGPFKRESYKSSSTMRMLFPNRKDYEQTETKI
ncbi:HGGxSTG domain-containing protein [Vibrio diazotrophicus]|uniref:HGGxSTG domain-containing protein n=1 Tax=Vibrio diazotrophicus TaxID=685 RepID=UPI0034C6B421